MTAPPEYIDPTDVAGVNERLRAWAAEDGMVHPVDIRHVVVAVDAIDSLVEMVRRLSGGGRTMLVVDRTSMRRGGEDLKALIDAAK